MHKKPEWKNSIHFTGIKSLHTFIVSILVFSIFLLLLAACSREVEGESITLEFAVDAVNASTTTTLEDFSEENCFVLRCSSFEVDEHGIVAETSKSRNLKATTLVFVEPIQTGNPEANYIQIAAVDITGKEYEYDIEQAKFYRVNPASAEAVIKNFGISYSDWQTGVINNSEKFPCCQ